MANRKKKPELSTDRYIIFTDVGRLINRELNITPMLFGSLAVKISLNGHIECKDVNALVPNELLTSNYDKLVEIMKVAYFTPDDTDKFIFDREGIKFSFSSLEDYCEKYNIDINSVEIVDDYAKFYLLSQRELLRIYSIIGHVEERTEAQSAKDKTLYTMLENEINRQITNNIKKFIRQNYDEDFYCKNYYTSIRVYNLATKIAKEEGANPFIVGLAAMLKFANKNGIKYTDVLLENKLTQHDINDIDAIIERATQDRAPREINAKCLYDAIIIDKLGAIGIAGAFGHDAKHDITMYNTELTRATMRSEQDYQNIIHNTIDYFHKVLMNLETKVKTNYGKKLAKRRTEFMQEYLYEFYDEWDGLI